MSEELKIIISAEVAKLKKGVEDAKNKIKEFKEKAAKTAKEVNEDFKKMGEGIKNAATKIGAGIAAFATALLANVSATEEYRNQQAQLITAFENVGVSAETAKETWNDLYRVLGDTGQAQEAAQHLAKLTQNEKDLEQWTTICQGVYATFGASLPIESLTEAANETAKTGSLTGALADALNWAGVSEEAFQEKLDKCNTEAEREKLIRETLNGLYDEAATKYETNNSKILAQRDAQAALQDKLAVLGETLAPVITAFTNFANTIIEKITPHIQSLAEQFLPQLSSILDTVATAIGNAIQWVIDNWDMISKIGTVILAIATALSVMSSIMSVVNGVMTVLSMNPITLAIAALVAVIAVCIVYWDDISAAAQAAWDWICSIWEGAAEWFSGIWEGIKGAFAAVGDWFSNVFKGAWEGVKNAWSNTKEWFAEKWEGIKSAFSTAKEWFGEKFKQAKEAATKAWDGIKTWASDTWGKVQSGFQNADSWMTEKFGDAWLGVKKSFEPFVNFFKQIWESVKSIFSVVKNVLTGNFSEAWEGIKGIFSSWGSFFKGLWNSITSIFKNVGQAIGNAVSGTVKKAVNAVLRTAVNIINGFISAINFAIGIINLIPGVNIGEIKKLSVPAMAKGGVVDSATLAVIGEQGKEAVVPLENNMEWLNKLAGMLNDKMGGGNKPIILNVDGKTFAETSINTINQLTKQTGTLGLAIV